MGGWKTHRFQAWEEVERKYQYGTVIKQASGYVIHIEERIVKENQIDGTRRKIEVDTVWKM